MFKLDLINTAMGMLVETKFVRRLMSGAEQTVKDLWRGEAGPVTKTEHYSGARVETNRPDVVNSAQALSEAFEEIKPEVTEVKVNAEDIMITQTPAPQPPRPARESDLDKLAEKGWTIKPSRKNKSA